MSACVKRRKNSRKKEKLCGCEAVLLDASCEIASRDFLRDVRRLSTGLVSLLPPPPPPPRPSAALLFSLSFNSPCSSLPPPSPRHSIPSLPPRLSVALSEKKRRKNKKQSGYEYSDRYWIRFRAFSTPAENC